MKEIASDQIICRLCNKNTLKDVIDLGQQYITSRFPVYGDFSTPSTPITLIGNINDGFYFNNLKNECPHIIEIII